MTKHYVTFLYPGILFPEESTYEVETRDPAKLDIPKGAYAFTFHDQEVTTFEGETLTGKPKNHSARYYIADNACVYTLEEVKNLFPDKRILISNMEGNGYKRVIRCNKGNFQPFEDDDVLI